MATLKMRKEMLGKTPASRKLLEKDFVRLVKTELSERKFITSN